MSNFIKYMGQPSRVRSIVSPTVDNPDQVSEYLSDNLDILGIILAAGQSSRYGHRNKLLEQVDNIPLIRHVVHTTQQSLINDMIAVTGYENERINRAIGDQCSTILNEDYQQGQSTSIACGINVAQNRDVDAAVILLGDMPKVSPDSINELIYAYDTTEYDILAASYNHQRGNPVLFDNAYFSELYDITGDTGGKDILFDNEDAALVETNDSGVLLDIDKPGDID